MKSVSEIYLVFIQIYKMDLEYKKGVRPGVRSAGGGPDRFSVIKILIFHNTQTHRGSTTWDIANQQVGE